MSWVTETVVPSRMSPAVRAELIDEMYATHQRIFAGVEKREFAAYVVESPAHSTRILLLRDAAGQLRGYAAFHVFLQVHLGRRMAVIRIEIGAEAAYRKSTFSGSFLAREFLRTALRFPHRQIWFMACFVHPSAYVSLVRHLPTAWPNPQAATPDPITRLMGSLARAFHLESAEAPGTYQVGWVATDDDRAPHRIGPHAAFYLRRNPSFSRGHGLMTVARVSLGRFAVGWTHYLAMRARRQVARWSKARPGVPGRPSRPSLDDPAPRGM